MATMFNRILKRIFVSSRHTKVKHTPVANVKAFDDVTRNLLDNFKIVAGNGAAFVEYEDHVNTEALGAALFQLTACFDEIGHVASGTVVRRPKDGLSLDVARDTVVVIARLKQHVHMYM